MCQTCTACLKKSEDLHHTEAAVDQLVGREYSIGDTFALSEASLLNASSDVHSGTGIARRIAVAKNDRIPIQDATVILSPES